MKKLILILVIIVATLNLLYTFGYQGDKDIMSISSVFLQTSLKLVFHKYG